MFHDAYKNRILVLCYLMLISERRAGGETYYIYICNFTIRQNLLSFCLTVLYVFLLLLFIIIIIIYDLFIIIIIFDIKKDNICDVCGYVRVVQAATFCLSLSAREMFRHICVIYKSSIYDFMWPSFHLHFGQ